MIDFVVALANIVGDEIVAEAWRIAYPVAGGDAGEN